MPSQWIAQMPQGTAAGPAAAGAGTLPGGIIRSLARSSVPVGAMGINTRTPKEHTAHELPRTFL